MTELILELNKFNGIVFNELAHSYHYNGVKCTSVTQLISNYKKKFETEIIASKYALKNGLSIDEVLTDWDLKRDTANARGTELHKYAELKFACKEYDVSEEQLSTDLKSKIDSFYEMSKGRLIPVASELIVGDSDKSLCGMIDQIFYNVKAKEFQIWDYKTNKEINMSSKYKSKMINGLNHLEECEYNTYSLQLSIYKKIIEKNTSLKIGKSYLCWINEENDSYQIIETKYFDTESTLMLNNRIDEYNFSLFE